MQEGSTSLKDLMFDRDMAYACTFGRVHQVRITISDSGIVCVCDIILGLISVCMHVPLMEFTR